MPFESYLTQPFEHEHENAQFDHLAAELNAVFNRDEEMAILMGNVMCGTAEFDALFIKSNAICVIEMKSIGGGEVKFRENGSWFCDDTEIGAGKHDNPFRQVRTYRFNLISELKSQQKEGALDPENPECWAHVSACVLFGEEIEIKGRFPKGLKAWFAVCDLTTIGAHLESISSPLIKLSRYDSNWFLEHFAGIDADERIRRREMARQKRIGELVLDRQSDLFQNLRELRIRAGASTKVANQVEQLIKDRERWEAALTAFPNEEIDSIRGARRYRVAPRHSMVVVSNHLFSSPVAVSIDHKIDKWIEANQGSAYIISEDGRITHTVIGAKGVDSFAATEINRPLLQRIELDLASLVPASFVRKGLLQLDESSTDEEIDEVVEAIGDETVQSLLSDLIYRLRANDLEAARSRLALFYGTSVEVSDLDNASVDAELNSEQMVAVGDLTEAELDRLLSPEHFAEWMIFLHPVQRKIALAEYQQRALLTGVSGSGKTCVLVHRARHLAKKYPGQRIGILTLNRNLSHLLENLVTSLCEAEEERQNISVHASYDYFQSLVEYFGPDQEIDNLLALGATDPEFGSEFAETLSRIDRGQFSKPFDPEIYSKRLERCWDEFMQNPVVRTKMTYFCDTLNGQAANVDPLLYLREEFSLIRSGCLTDRREEEYLALKRKGRAIRLTQKDRKNVLSLLLLFEETLLKAGLVDELGLTLMVSPHIRNLPDLPEHLRFRCLLIDEFQDLSTRDLAILQRIIPQQPDALFLTGDMVQQVMVKTLDLNRVGFSPGAYAKEHIEKNYRNSRQILVAANDLVLHYGQIARSQNEEIELLEPEFAIRETTAPKAIETENDPEAEVAKAWEIAAECLEESGAQAWSVCIATAAPEDISVQAILDAKPTGQTFSARPLTGDYIEAKNAMMVGTMSDVKGFEFSVIIVVGCGQAYLPSPGRASEEIWRDALRLYVAMTRARDLVYLIYSGQPSSIIATMNDHIDWIKSNTGN